MNPPDTPEMNAITEQKWRTLNQMARCMLLRSVWDAYQAAVWIVNKTPTKTARGWMTPHEFVFGDAPDIGNLQVWGSKTFVKRPRDANRNDFSETTKTGFLLGYFDTQKGIKFLSLTLTVLCIVFIVPSMRKFRIVVKSTLKKCGSCM